MARRVTFKRQYKPVGLHARQMAGSIIGIRVVCMSITPTGGWGDPSRRDAQQGSDSPPSVGAWTRGSQPSSMPRSTYLTCKVCDSGTLSSKTVFRMSGPVAAIGFILLVPSILGIIFSAFVFFGVNISSALMFFGIESAANTSDSIPPFQSDFDASFRKSCAVGVRQTNQEVGYHASQQLIEQYCECSLSTFKETGSETTASQTCLQKATEGTLEPLSPDVDAFYSGNSPSRGLVAPVASLATSVIGSGYAIAIGIASFVGGLLGWLLVMRKRVLQCNVCGAVVNAS